MRAKTKFIELNKLGQKEERFKNLANLCYQAFIYDPHNDEVIKEINNLIKSEGYKKVAEYLINLLECDGKIIFDKNGERLEVDFDTPEREMKIFRYISEQYLPLNHPNQKEYDSEYIMLYLPNDLF